MRVARVLSIFAAAGLFAGAGCASAHHQPAPTASPRVAAAPSDPDVRPVVERFYQLVEGAHWAPAYGMLSQRCRAAFSRAQLEERYRDFSNADVNARQTGTRTAAVRLTAPAHNGRPAQSLNETLRFAWDGEAWTIDDITPR